ncbi:MAG: Asp23/Gls24 family envelope stress response protein [Actinomycetaceae bacterium]|nr:Asp23/Gls24 family envelope stress response protein [Actinomycetaceae bacterium]
MAEKNVNNENLPVPAKPETNVGADQGRGVTTIQDSVVAKIAGLAIENIPGVYSLGGTMSRAIGSMREAVGASKDITQGVSVEVGEIEAAVDIKLIVEYPHPVHEVADQVRDAVFEAVEGLVGLDVKEVNIDITDVHVVTEKELESKENKSSESEGRVK